jgi:uncharacterized protein DUF262/uncharacterized protein DUF1524
LSFSRPDTPTIGLGQFIKEARFRVPSHQRDYSWRDELIKQFIDDIISALEDGETSYFCGLMVFTQAEEENVLQVLDGQQRLATTLMIFSAVRNWLAQFPEFAQPQTQIEERYLGDSELGRTEIEPKLILNRANNDVFRKYVIEPATEKEIADAMLAQKRSARNRILLDAILSVNRRIADIAKSHMPKDTAKDYLLSLVNCLTKVVQVVSLIVRGDEAAYTIFETLNDRGLELAPLDLVKNYLFSRAEKGSAAGGKSLADLEERWAEMMTLLSTVKADSFLRAFWASRHGAPEGRKLFGPFKKQYAKPKDAYRVSIEMRATAEQYVALSDPDDSVWQPFSDKAKVTVGNLAIIGATQLHPVILSALSRFDKREMERLLKLLEVIAVRYQLVGRGRPGRIESLGGRTAKKIFDKEIATARQAMTELKELYIEDNEFRSNFETKIERESKKAAFLLRGLEHQQHVLAQDRHANELVPSTVITVEHILPKSPGPAWNSELNADKEFHKDCLYRLGNLCLLADANRALGNKAFAEKKRVYSTSQISVTNGVARVQSWNRKEVEKRQKHFAKLAVAEWRFQ